MARESVIRTLNAIGGEAKLRMKDGAALLTDNGNVIVDLHGLQIVDPIALEKQINNIVGVVTVGLFAVQGANVCLLGTAEGVKTFQF
jgi:ribose 5-phosphate isomerase A